MTTYGNNMMETIIESEWCPSELHEDNMNWQTCNSYVCAKLDGMWRSCPHMHCDQGVSRGDALGVQEPSSCSYLFSHIRNALPTVLHSYCSCFSQCTVKDELRQRMRRFKNFSILLFLFCFFASTSNRV